MSIRKETYIVYGFAFGEKFTNEYWKKEFRDEMEWDESKPDKISFITDGMNGDYTFFGKIIKLSKGYDENYREIEINTNGWKDIVRKFSELYPGEEIPELKMYYLPHFT